MITLIAAPPGVDGMELDTVTLLLSIAVVSIWLLCLSPWEDHQWPKRMRSPQKRKFTALIVVVATGVGLWWNEAHGEAWISIYGLVLAAGQGVGAVLEHEFGWFE